MRDSRFTKFTLIHKFFVLSLLLVFSVYTQFVLGNQNKGVEVSKPFFSLDALPPFGERDRIEFFKDRSGKIFLGYVSDFTDSNKPREVRARVRLYSFPQIKDTGVQFLINDAEETGYKHFFWRTFKLDGQWISFQGIGGKLPAGCHPSSFQTYFTKGPHDSFAGTYDTELMFYIELEKPLVHLNPESCWYFWPGEVKQKIVSLNGDIVRDGEKLYIVDQHSQIIFPLNLDLSIKNYCDLPGIYRLNFKNNTKKFRAIMSMENTRDYSEIESLIKNLLEQSKEKECS